MQPTTDYLILALRLFGSLALLVFGMKQMSESLQKMAGPQLRNILRKMTTNRFTGLLTGATVTAAVQSSTATTVMTVSFVNASLLTLAQAIGVIMGANIGTTLTAWIMSAGFAFDITNVVWPAFVVALILIYSKKNETIGSFIFGLAFMFLGPGTLRATGADMNLGENQALLNFFESFDPESFTTTILFLLIGGILTMCVQSSAAVMAITMILCSSGALPIYQGIALVMGENIGTTVTSNLAALTASTQARRAALAHMLFNIFGVCWMLVVFHPFVNMVCGFVGYDTQMERDLVAPDVFLANAAKLSVVLAAFHTCFNVVNTAILIWFIPQIEKVVCKIIKKKKSADGVDEDDQPEKLVYIDRGLVHTPEIAVLQAQKEVTHYADRIQRMYGMVTSLVDEKDKEKFAKTVERIAKYEGIADRMEIEIATYLEKVSDRHLSDETKSKIRSMMRQISEIESIGDACYNLSRTLNRKMETGKVFTDWQNEKMKEMMDLTNQSLTQMNRVLNGKREDSSLKETFRIENEINTTRDKLKAENINAVNEHKYDYAVGTLFNDLVSECEKLGDYVVNVVQARLS